jgi:hypothetical protein
MALDMVSKIGQNRPFLSRNIFCDDVCLRCGRLFVAGEIAVSVHGSGAAKYRSIGIVICRECICSDFDTVYGKTLYVPAPDSNGEPSWPRYWGSDAIRGFALLHRLETGLCRVALHRGHVEILTPEEKDNHRFPGIGVMAYDPSFTLYGPYAVLGPKGIRVIERKFVDLSKPESSSARTIS